MRWGVGLIVSITTSGKAPFKPPKTSMRMWSSFKKQISVGTLESPIDFNRNLKSIFVVSKMVVSCRSEEAINDYLPGGTFMATLGKYSSRVIQTGNDFSGLGRWTFVELAGKRDRRLIILNGYRVCKRVAHCVCATVSHSPAERT